MTNLQKKSISLCKRAALMKQLSQTIEMLQGSLITKYVRCGKERCRCKDGQGHGPVYYLSSKEKGITQLVYIPQDKIEKVKQQVAKFREYKAIGSKIAHINKEILKAK
jgi:diphthamide synthase subunit DPH2